MKKNIIIIAIILMSIITICTIKISLNKQKLVIQKNLNAEYEQYLNKEIYGTDVISIINKAINDNEKNNIAQDEKGNFIENDNSIIVELVMITNQEKEEKKTYRMETINRGGIEKFITNFNTEKFIITKIEYHKETNRIKYIEISEQ